MFQCLSQDSPTAWIHNHFKTNRKTSLEHKYPEIVSVLSLLVFCCSVLIRHLQHKSTSALTLVGLWLLRSPVLVVQISEGEPTTFSILPLLFPLPYTCLPLTLSQPERSTKANHHHRPSTLCCTPEESREREGLLYGIFVEGKCPL